jgi:hypothetical protein
VDVDVGAHLDLLDLDDLLVLARFRRLLLVGVFQFAEIENLDDGRRGVGRDLDEVETGFLGALKRILDGNVAVVLAVCVDQLDAWNADVPVCAGALLDGRSCLEWSANGRGLLEPLVGFAVRAPYVGSSGRESIARRNK